MKIKSENIPLLFKNFDITKILFDINECAFYEDFFVESLQESPDKKKLDNYIQFGCITNDNVIIIPCAYYFSIKPSEEGNLFCCTKHNISIEISDKYFKIPDIHLKLSDIGSQYKTETKSDNLERIFKAYCKANNLEF